MSGNCDKIYDGERVVAFSVNGSKLLALTNSKKVLYWDDYMSSYTQAELPSKIYSDMVVDWERGLIYISTFDLGDSGVYVTNFNKLFDGGTLRNKQRIA